MVLVLLVVWWAVPKTSNRAERRTGELESTSRAAEHRVEPAVEAPDEAEATGPNRFEFLVTAAGAPVEGVEIESKAGTLLGRTGEQGRLQLVSNAPYSVVYVTRKRGFLAARGYAYPDKLNRVELRPGLLVAGRVLHAHSKAPVSGAAVRVWDKDEDEELAALLTTDSEGRFECAVRADHPFVLVVSAPGVAPVTVQRTIAAPLDDLVVFVGGGGMLVGTVRDAESKPAAGLAVYVVDAEAAIPIRTQHRDPGPPSGWALFAVPRTSTDESGAYEIRGLALDRSLAAVVRVSEDFDARSEPVRFTRDGDTFRRDIGLPLPANLRVLYGDGSVPFQATLVTKRERFTRGYRERESDGSRFFAELAPGRYLVRVFPENGSSLEKQIELSPGEVRKLVLQPPEGGVVQGVVVTPDGEPVPMASLAWTGRTSVLADADERGRFTIRGAGDLPGTLKVDAGMTLDDTPLAGVTLKGVVPGGAPLRVVLRRGASLTGRITGAPAGTQIQFGYFSINLGGGASSDLAEDGRFRHDSTTLEEEFTFVIKAKGYAPLVRTESPLKEGETRDLGELLLDQGVVASAAVRGANGEAVQGAQIVIAERWTFAKTRTDTDGVFRFPRMPRKPLHLRIEAKGYPARRVVLRPGVDAFTLTMGGAVEVSVLNAAGQPRQAAVWFRPVAPGFDPDRTSEGVKSRPDGTLRWRLQPGRYTATVWSDKAKKNIERACVIREGETTAVEFKVP